MAAAVSVRFGISEVSRIFFKQKNKSDVTKTGSNGHEHLSEGSVICL